MKMNEVRAIAKKWGVDTRVGRTKKDIIRDIQIREGFEPCYQTKSECGEMHCLWRQDCLKHP
ncbi:MAG: SAP domain-containing protein [Deltaproteobacteria bacterium]|nr:SAP domain-containing protein [Deltaproteobacteria bacterium]